MEIRALLSAMWRSKTGPLLVGGQVALTLAVVVNMAYVVRQGLDDASKPTGLDLNNMFWVETQATTADYNIEAAAKEDLVYLNTLSGVVAATTINRLPQTRSVVTLPFAPRPEDLQKPGWDLEANVYFGTEQFIDAMGLKLIAGRNFDSSVVVPPSADLGAAIAKWAPEMIITQALAKQLFPQESALGKTVYVGLINRSAVVVGVVDLLRANPGPAQFDKYATRVVIVPIVAPGPNGKYVVRAKPGRRDQVMADVERSFGDLQPGRFVERIEPYDRTAAEARAGYRANAIILTVVSAFVLLVTIVGIVGLTAFSVTTRTKQLGTRRAIGARKLHIVRYFLVENWIIMTGCVVGGCVLALAAGVQPSRMYQMPRLPLYYLVGGTLLMWIVGLLAVLVPSLRAASISPAVATRTV